MSVQPSPPGAPTIESVLTKWRDAGVAQVDVFKAAMARGRGHAARRIGEFIEGTARAEVASKALALVVDLREAGCDDAEVKRRLLGELRRSVLSDATYVPTMRTRSAADDEVARCRLSARAMLLDGLMSAWPGVLGRDPDRTPGGMLEEGVRLIRAAIERGAVVVGGVEPRTVGEVLAFAKAMRMGGRAPAGWVRTADRLPPECEHVVGLYPSEPKGGIRVTMRYGDDWFDHRGDLDAGLDGVPRVPLMWAPIPELPELKCEAVASREGET